MIYDLPGLGDIFAARQAAADACYPDPPSCSRCGCDPIERNDRLICPQCDGQCTECGAEVSLFDHKGLCKACADFGPCFCCICPSELIRRDEPHFDWWCPTCKTTR